MIKWFEKNNVLSWAITIFFAVIIFFFSSLTFESVGSSASRNWMPIAYHIIIFFFLSLFLFISLLKGKENFGLFIFAFLISLSYGILDEIHQFFVKGRLCSLGDVGFDLMGISLAFLIYLISLKKRKL